MIIRRGDYGGMGGDQNRRKRLGMVACNGRAVLITVTLMISVLMALVLPNRKMQTLTDNLTRVTREKT